jgi:hypothetical protein
MCVCVSELNMNQHMQDTPHAVFDFLGVPQGGRLAISVRT